MIYCAMCSAPLLERTVSEHKILLCSLCGALYVQTGERKYRYAGTTRGNQQLRELLAFIDAHEKEVTQNETMALEIDTVT